MRTTTLWILATVALVGCKKVEPVPADLDELMHFVWQHMEEGDDEMLGEAIANLHGAIDGNTLEDVLEGQVSDLSMAEVEGLQRKGPTPNPKEATGVLLADRIGCSPEGLEAILAHKAQDELYTGVYDSYNRTMTLPPEAFLSREDDWLSWDLVYTTSALGAGYEVRSQTLMRRVRDARKPGEDAVILRAHMLEPAAFDNEDTNQFLDQDYHLEIYWPHDGGMLHAYALWKDTRLLGFEDEDKGTQRITINKLVQWDEGTTQLCEEGRP